MSSPHRDTLNCLLFGFGYMGRIRHAVLDARKDIGRIVVVDPLADPDSPTLRGIEVMEYDAVPWDEFDCAFVCTPNSESARLCVSALERGLHVFCEKPPGRNCEEVRAIADTASGHPELRLSFGFNHRLHPAALRAAELLKNKALGDPLFAKGTYGKSPSHAPDTSWRSDPTLSGGGILIDQGIHMIDLLNTLIGKLTPRRALLTSSGANSRVEDNAFVIMESTNGIPVFVHSSDTLLKPTFHLEIGLTKGYIDISGLLSKTGRYGPEVIRFGESDECFSRNELREKSERFLVDESWEREVGEFVSAIMEARPCRHGTIEQALEVMALIRDIYELGAPLRLTNRLGSIQVRDDSTEPD